MPQFADRQAVLKWLNAHERQRVRLSDTESTLRIVGRTAPVNTLDACSTEFKEVHLDAGLPGVEIDATLQDEALTLLVRVTHEGEMAGLVLPFTIPYARLRLAPAGTSEAGDSSRASEEPDFSPYELLHRSSSD